MGQGERANRIGCPEFRRNLAMDRRGFVKAGALGLGGLSLANLMQLEAGVKDRSKVSNEKSDIILWKRGGARQHTLDDLESDLIDGHSADDPGQNRAPAHRIDV